MSLPNLNEKCRNNQVLANKCTKNFTKINGEEIKFNGPTDSKPLEPLLTENMIGIMNTKKEIPSLTYNKIRLIKK